MRTAIRAAVAALSCAACLASAQDYEREKRWSDEVVPGLVVGDAVWIEAASGRRFLGLYASAKEAKGALVIVHGIGVHPDHGMIGVLRSKLNDRGYSTLAIQMPVLAADKRGADYYPKLFPDAIDRIRKAAAWLVAKEGPRVAIVSHSMGSWMTNAYFDETADSPFRAWACLGLTGGYSWGAYFSPRALLDVYGEDDMESSLSAAWRRRMTVATGAAGSRQVMIAGADHFYARKDDELAATVADWLSGVLR